MANGDREELTYWLDRDDTIVRVSDGWDTVAREGGGSCVEQHVLGELLWRFVDGDPTRMLLARLFACVRETGEPLRSAYRCDTPELRRLCELSMTPGGARSVAVRHRIVRVEPWPRSIHIRRAIGGEICERCSLCNRVHAAGRWLEVSRAVALGVIDAQLSVVYTVCSDCKRSVERELEERLPSAADVTRSAVAAAGGG